MKRSVRSAVVVLLACTLYVNGFATTWAPKEFTCPIDNEKNTFMVVMSYGSYIYSWPSKYQWVFWPQTDSPTFYTCRKCHLTTFMWDFDKIPKEKVPELKKMLAGVNTSVAFKDYNELPVTERLEIMEKVYKVLNKDEDWWERFYRLQGYHYGKAGDQVKADGARRRSLDLIEKELKSNAADASPKKMLLYISAAMKHFLRDDKGALEDLQTALATKYANRSETAEEVKNAETGFNERINDYIERIKSEKQKPRLFDKFDPGEH